MDFAFPSSLSLSQPMSSHAFTFFPQQAAGWCWAAYCGWTTTETNRNKLKEENPFLFISARLFSKLIFWSQCGLNFESLSEKPYSLIMIFVTLFPGMCISFHWYAYKSSVRPQDKYSSFAIWYHNNAKSQEIFFGLCGAIRSGSHNAPSLRSTGLLI